MNTRTHPPKVSRSKVLRLSLLMLLVLLAAALLSLALGTAKITLAQMWDVLRGHARPEDPAALILLRIRLPRILLAGIVGYALSLGGVIFQALLRNPLADPFVLGVSSGAAFGAVMAIFLGLSDATGVPALAFLGALLTLGVLVRLGRRRVGTESATILLTGVIINAFFTAMIMFLIAVVADSRLHAMLFWLYGDLSQGRFGRLLLIGPLVVTASGVLYGFARHLNLMTAGEETALQLGVDVERAKRTCLILTSLVIGLVVAFSGLIGFVGLMVPHLARMAVGADHRLLMPVAALGGAAFLICADTLARTLISPGELPVGVITAFLGAPFFLYLLRKRGNQWGTS